MTLFDRLARHLRHPVIGLKYLAAGFLFVAQINSVGAEDLGQKVYDYYCYQCHAYDGTARTLASRNVTPPPRDFTSSNPQMLDRKRMIQSVTHGRTGTAMVAFKDVLKDSEIDAVVEFIRHEFLGKTDNARRYHVPENGWHDFQRYEPAFPFVLGTLEIEHVENPSSSRPGQALFLSACVSCHEPLAEADQLQWELRGVSYPHGNYLDDEDLPPQLTIDTFKLHRVAIDIHTDDPALNNGGRLYSEHCAHCHAADGTGRNWIGAFLEPHPPDFTDQGYMASLSVDEFRLVVKKGTSGTSMPAWRNLLSDDDLDDLIHWFKTVFHLGTGIEAVGATKEMARPPESVNPMQWRRIN